MIEFPGWGHLEDEAGGLSDLKVVIELVRASFIFWEIKNCFMWLLRAPGLRNSTACDLSYSKRLLLIKIIASIFFEHQCQLGNYTRSPADPSLSSVVVRLFPLGITRLPSWNRDYCGLVTIATNWAEPYQDSDVYCKNDRVIDTRRKRGQGHGTSPRIPACSSLAASDLGSSWSV